MEWHADARAKGCINLHGLPLWRDHHGAQRVSIWIQQRPAYCDRGRYHAMTDAPLDHQEGWPRYYFDIDVAKREVEAWVRVRSEFHEPERRE